MLNTLGLQRTKLGSREIDLLSTKTSITQEHLAKTVAQMAHSYRILPEQAQEGMQLLDHPLRPKTDTARQMRCTLPV